MKHSTPASLSAALTAAAAFLTPSTAFLPPQHHRTTILPITQLSATPASAISTLSTSQATTISTIASAIPDLAPKPALSLDGTTLIAGSPTTLDARDAPGPANVAWLAGVTVADKMSSLTIFNGPLTDVPHLLSRAVVVDDGTSLTLDLDFRPRAYGAYELKDAQGNYPGPETFGRQAFEYSGNRKDFETKYGTEELISFLQATVASMEGAAPSPRAPSEFDKLTDGPLVMSITMPLTDGNVAAVDRAMTGAANFWLRWATEGGHEHRPGAPINSQYVYDTKYRQNAYSGLLGIYEGIFGAGDGAVLAAKESGPLDEAYVGGGS
mmetsp:Transcript_14041/g.17692  ORF Transcript_14041/g.17692 Transcript_14041/m.17692 type:complete len:324 (+) Transcript_14041:128-1099(+)